MTIGAAIERLQTGHDLVDRVLASEIARLRKIIPRVGDGPKVYIHDLRSPAQENAPATRWVRWRACP